MIFDQLSLEYFLAGKNLPWNKLATVLAEGEFDALRVHVVHNRPGVRMESDRYPIYMFGVEAAKPQYFNLKG